MHRSSSAVLTTTIPSGASEQPRIKFWWASGILLAEHEAMLPSATSNSLMFINAGRCATEIRS
jgi:hypothetical protein